MKYDYIVVGAGLAGGIIARNLAEKKDKKVLIVERRNHVAGNTYDYCDEHGIKVQKYGPHVIHTNSEKVYKYVTRFCDPIPYRTKCEVVMNGVSTPSPFNFKTIDQFYSEKEAAALKTQLLDYYKGRQSVTVVEMLECSNDAIRSFAEFLFDNDYKLYTAKQWNLDPSEIDPAVLKRVPIVLSYGDTYFYDKYEFMPKDGFASLFNTIIDHSNITIETGIDALDHITVNEKKQQLLYDGVVKNIVYTGAIDELFGFKYGVLPYRSLHFDFCNINADSFQNAAIVAYPQVEGYTRITEYTKMPFQECNGWTCAAYEYPVPYDRTAEIGREPYYPVLTDLSKKNYLKYKEYSKNYQNLTLVGRLAEFKYYNMDQVILRSLEVFESMEV